MPNANALNERLETAAAKQEIAELRCLYAKATDLIGTGEPAAVAEGRAIYHRIFTPDAVIAASVADSVTGPDAWVDVVLEALEDYRETQHLIGTQLVDIEALPGTANAGSARMQSYLQAWHSKANGHLWLFMGSYDDQVIYSDAHGWQISNMMLNEIVQENRQLGTDEA
ncbi:MAG: nuclear transport factor 2 family protein [Pseudomonadales bacterium]